MEKIKFRVIVANKIFGYERLNDCGRWESMVPELNPDKGERWMPVVIDIVNAKRDQFTGLLDMHKKEVYKGDILKFTHHGGYLLEDTIMEVCFDSRVASFGYKDSNSMFSEVIFPFSNHDELERDVLQHAEIIGNIYENKELLNP